MLWIKAAGSCDQLTFDLEEKKMLKHLFTKRALTALLLACALTLSLVGCGSADSSKVSSAVSTSPQGTGADAGGSAAGTKFTVAISLNSLDEYQTMMTQCLEEELAKLGGTLVQYNADGSAEKQLADVESIILTAPDVIVIQAVDPDGTVTAVKTAHASGIPTVVYQLTCNVEAEDFDARVVQQDPMVRGKVQAAWIKNYLDENPDEVLNVCSLMGAPNGGSNGYKGWQTMYEDEAYQGRVSEIIATDANWSRANAISIVEDWLVTYPEMNCIQAENDEMALGAVTAIKNAGLNPGDYIIMGMNGDPEAQKAIKAGEMTMTAANSKRAQSAICAQVCQKLAQGERYEGEGKYFYTDSTYQDAMDINTIDEYLASGNYD